MAIPLRIRYHYKNTLTKIKKCIQVPGVVEVFFLLDPSMNTVYAKLDVASEPPSAKKLVET